MGGELCSQYSLSVEEVERLGNDSFARASTRTRDVSIGLVLQSNVYHTADKAVRSSFALH